MLEGRWRGRCITMMGKVMKPGSFVTSFQDVRKLTGHAKPSFLPLLAEVLLRFLQGEFFFVNHKCQPKTTQDLRHSESEDIYIRQNTICITDY